MTSIGLRELRQQARRLAKYAVADLQRYTQTHAHRMHYRECRAHGYAVTSAAVESAGHGVLQRRRKRPG